MQIQISRSCLAVIYILHKFGLDKSYILTTQHFRILRWKALQ
jgi:hypothetical protein